MGIKIAEYIYRKSPVFFQNLGVSIYGFFYKHERLGGRFEEYSAEFKKRSEYSKKQMDAFIESELKRIVLLAYENVDFYREFWNAAGLKEQDLKDVDLKNLYKIPLISKKYLHEHPEKFVLGKNKKLHRYATSGSTGTPITCFYTKESHRKFIAAREVRSFNWAGVSIKMPRAMIGGRMIVPAGSSKPPFYRYNAAEQQIYLSAFHIAPQNIPDYVHGLNLHRPQVFTGYAYSYYFLARMMKEQNLSLAYQPKAIILGSEKITADMRGIIKEIFRAHVYEEYGAVENCFLATECPEGSLHVHPDFGIIEIVDEKGRPLPPGERGKIVCTGLSNDVQLFIRYEIGDEGILSAEPCSCGRNQLPILKEISGRIEDTVIGPDGRQIVRFHGIFVNLPHILEGQVIQEKVDEFRVLVVTALDFNQEDEVIIKRRFFERLGHVRVKVEQVPFIDRTSRGKFRAVISRVTDNE